MSIIHQALKKIEGARHGPGPRAEGVPGPKARRSRTPALALAVAAALILGAYLSMPYWPFDVPGLLQKGGPPGVEAKKAPKAGPVPPEKALDVQAAAPAPGPTGPGQNARGVEQYRAGLYQEAAASLNEAIRLDPGLAPAHNNLALALMALGDDRGAEAHLKTALGLLPGYPEALNNLGVVYAARGDEAEAKKAFKEAIARDPALADAHFNLAVLLERADDYQGAAGLYQEYMRLVSGPAPGQTEAAERIKELKKKVWHLKTVLMTRSKGSKAEDVR